MKVLLLSPPFLPGYMRNARCDFVSLSGTQWYPILLGYCGAWLENRGHEVLLVDAPACRLNHSQTERLVAGFHPDWLVVYTGRLSEDNDIAFSDRLTERLGCGTIIVGPYASIAPGDTLRKSERAACLVTGEFELPIGEIVEGRSPEGIPNLVYREGERIIRNPERPYLSGAELDRIPFVSQFFKRHLDIHRYRTPSEPYPFMDILTGRGCGWGLCTYCLWVHSYVRGPIYHARGIDNVIEELRCISRDMPEIKSVMLQDDTMPEERLIELSDAKLKAGITLPWSCYVRGVISYDALKLMKRASCLNLHVGFESADPGILKAIKKGVSRERMTQFAKEAKHAGLRIHGDFAIGFPGETEETVRKTVAWACEIRPHTAQFQLMIPFPGTPFHAELKEGGLLKDGAPDYPQLSRDKMEDLVRGAYRKFYISLPFLKHLLRHPWEMFFSRLGTYSRALNFLLWKRYVR